MQRIVRRSDLRSDEDSTPEPPGSEMDSKAHEIQQFDYVGPQAFPQDVERIGKRELEEDMEFNLFAPSRSTKTADDQPIAATKIRLRSPSIDLTQQGFIGTERDRSCYFTDPLSKQKEEEFASSAMTGEQILTKSQCPWPGSEYSWKILRIPSSDQSKDVATSAPALFHKLVGASQPIKRTRPGKKYRIKLRTKRAALLSKQEAAKAAAEAKDAAEREKKTRKNREKKAKKRARDKAKVAAEGDDAGSPEAGEDDREKDT